MSKPNVHRRSSIPPRLLAVFMLALVLVLVSCNVTRKVTTTSTYQAKGDTTVIIQSKTVESYDATKRVEALSPINL